MPNQPPVEQPIARVEGAVASNKPKPERPPVDANEQTAGRNISSSLNQEKDPDVIVKDIAEGNVIGGKRRADGTWDMSHAAIGISSVQPNHVDEVLKTVREKFTETGADPQPGSLGKVIQHLEETRGKLLKAHIDPADEARANDINRIRQQLEEEREVVSFIIASRAIDLWGGGEGSYEAFLPEAKKLSAMEAGDILDSLETDWYDQMATATEKDKKEYKTRLATAGRLKTKLINEQSNVSQDESLEQRSAELAKLTREKGFGQLYGYTYPMDKVVGGVGFYPGRGFAIGQEIIDNDGAFRRLQRVFLRGRSFRDKIWDPYDQQHRQVWAAADYGRPTHYEGRELNSNVDWVQYTYEMPVDSPYDTRPGGFTQLNIAVPVDIAKKLDAAVAEDPLFPDRYLKSLFPGMVGEDGKTHLRRHRATELAVVDDRGNSGRKVDIKQLSQPIEY